MIFSLKYSFMFYFICIADVKYIDMPLAELNTCITSFIYACCAFICT